MTADISTEDAIVDAISSWRSIEQLVDFAVKRQGYCNSDGGFGVTYPSDLDEYQLEVEKISIPEGTVAVFGFWGLPNAYDILVEETVYLRCLAKRLQEDGRDALAKRIDALVSQL